MDTSKSQTQLVPVAILPPVPRVLSIQASIGKFNGDYVRYFFYECPLDELVAECRWMADQVLVQYESLKKSREWVFHLQWKEMAT